MKKKFLVCFLNIILLTTTLAGCNSPAKSVVTESGTDVASSGDATITPFGAYEDTVVYTLGKMTSSNNSNMPVGDTYENNAYTRYLKDVLNVQNKDAFEATDNQYDTSVSMVMAMDNLPDVMVVNDYKQLRELVDNDMIEDLTDSYNNCLSDTIKDMYGSYGDSLLDVVSFGGKIMALPETNITDGPNLLWLRRDWMDKLGLSSPSNVSEAMDVIKKFVESGISKVGLVCDTSLSGECGYSSEYLLDTIFASFGAYPKQWIENENGEVVYGSVTDKAKQALGYINGLYNEKILDDQFLIRTTSNIIELIEDGDCGSFFGPWWAANNPLVGATSSDADAVWEPYLLATDSYGVTEYHSQNPTYKYVVVRKGYEHPEIAAKIISVLFDKIRFEADKDQQFIDYYQQNVEPTARPLSINVDYNNALQLCYGQLTDTLKGVRDKDSLNLLERSYYDACEAYLSNTGKSNSADKESATATATIGRKGATAMQWAAYMSRIKACSLLESESIKKVESLFFGTTETMKSEWWKLKEKENQTYLKIVSGDEDVSYFDTFVQDWYDEGGRDVTEEVRTTLSK